MTPEELKKLDHELIQGRWVPEGKDEVYIKADIFGFSDHDLAERKEAHERTARWYAGRYPEKEPLTFDALLESGSTWLLSDCIDCDEGCYTIHRHIDYLSPSLLFISTEKHYIKWLMETGDYESEELLVIAFHNWILDEQLKIEGPTGMSILSLLQAFYMSQNGLTWEGEWR